MDRVCVYLRKSREDEELEKAFGEGETLIKHRKALIKYAKDHALNIVKMYEEVVSGEKLIHRPAMLELLKEVEQGLYDAVLCMDIQRLGRGDMQDQGLILNTFKASGTKIVTLQKIYDLNNEFDEEYSEFEAFMARKEYKMITRRMQGGRIRSVQDGNYVGTYPPFGYVLHETRQYRTLAPHPEQADVVKLIFDRYVNKSMGCAKIAAELNMLGCKSYTGKSWERTAITHILKNQVYIGKVVWKKKCIRKSTEPGKTKDTRTRPENEWIVADGKHPALVDEVTFHRAQQIIGAKYHAPYQEKSGLQNPLAGLVICWKCGAKMKKRPYTHGGPHILCERCDNKSSRMHLIEQRILTVLENWMQAFQLQLQAGPVIPPSDSNVPVLKKVLDSLQKELADLKGQKLKLHDLLEQGVYDAETFVERSRNITERMDRVSQSMIKAQETLEQEQKKNELPSGILPQVKRVLEVYAHTEDVEEKNRLLKSILEKVVYWKEKDQKGDQFSLVIFPKLHA